MYSLPEIKEKNKPKKIKHDPYRWCVETESGWDIKKVTRSHLMPRNQAEALKAYLDSRKIGFTDYPVNPEEKHYLRCFKEVPESKWPKESK